MPSIPDIFSTDPSLPEGFEKQALLVFRHQFEHNAVYREFCEMLRKEPGNVRAVSDIPFLPIRFFKSHKVVSFVPSGDEAIFTSSGTTGQESSRHIVKETSLYEKSFRSGFIRQYGQPESYIILALLPSYLERQGSSLVYMMQKLVEESAHPLNGFFMNDLEALHKRLDKALGANKRIMLFGVSYALLEFAERFPRNMRGHYVVETGGMKGQRKEMVREELHETLQKAFCVESIHSEYGMTELTSQAWSKGEGVFHCPPWMRVLVRDTDNPMQEAGINRTGGLNIIDLANYHSCSFIATDDLGKMHADGSFEVLGRFDHAEVRGCNLMYRE